MSALFLTLLELGLSASVLALVVVLLRLLPLRWPRWVYCLLWALVALRLVCPVSIESDLSLQPRIEQTAIETAITSPSTQIIPDNSPSRDTLTSPATPTPSPDISGGLVHHAGGAVSSKPSLISIFAGVWLVGAAAMLLYALVGYLRLRHCVLTATRLRDGIYQSEWVDSPFVLGLIRPKIYLPYNLDEETTAHVIAHEQSHLHRADHWWKPLGYLLLSVYWFCPVLWLAYWLLCRDIELACDARVVRTLTPEARQHYALTLLKLGIRRNSIAACPLAFGELGVKQRVKRALSHKKPAFWVVVVSLAALAAVAVCFLTSPKTPKPSVADINSPLPENTSWFLLSDNPAYDTLPLQSVEIPWMSQGGIIFQNPNAAFDAMLVDCAEAISYLEKRSGHAPLSRDNYRQYQDSIRNLPEDDTPLRNQCLDLFRFLEVYDRSTPHKDTPGCIIVSAPKIQQYGFFAIGQFLMQDAGLSYRPEDGSAYQEISLGAVLDGDPRPGETLTTLDVTNEHGQTIYSNSDQGSVAYDDSYTRQELLLLLEERVLLTPDNELAQEQWDQLIPETVEEIQILRFPRAEDRTETAYSVYWFDGIPTWFVEGEHLRFYEIITSYGAETYAQSVAQTPLDAAISQAILDRLLPEKPDELVYCESHVNLTQETVIACGSEGSPDCGTWTTVYTMVMESVFSLSGGTPRPVSGSHYPAAITFREEGDGSYTLTEFWTPRDGAHLEPDVRQKFPDEVETDALDTQKFALRQSQNCYAQVLEYTGIQPDHIIAGLLFEIIAGADDDQAPAECIQTHVRAYGELLSYGRYTLEYAFRQFLMGGQNNLSGEIMAAACQEIMLQWGEALIIDTSNALTGQAWFDEFRENAYRLEEQYSRQELQELYPGTWLLLQLEKP